MKPQQKHVVDTVLKIFNFTGLDDHKTTITKTEAFEGIAKLEALKSKILSHIPKEYTNRLRDGVNCGTDAICALRQLIRFTKFIGWFLQKNKWEEVKQNEVEYSYRII